MLIFPTSFKRVHVSVFGLYTSAEVNSIVPLLPPITYNKPFNANTPILIVYKISENI